MSDSLLPHVRRTFCLIILHPFVHSGTFKTAKIDTKNKNITETQTQRIKTARFGFQKNALCPTHSFPCSTHFSDSQMKVPDVRLSPSQCSALTFLTILHPFRRSGAFKTGNSASRHHNTYHNTKTVPQNGTFRL